jgi:hypothetical protein
MPRGFTASGLRLQCHRLKDEWASDFVTSWLGGGGMVPAHPLTQSPVTVIWPLLT